MNSLAGTEGEVISPQERLRKQQICGAEKWSSVLAGLCLKYLEDIKAEISRYMILEFLEEVRSGDKIWES